MVKYTAEFESISGLFRTRHISGWQITCDPGTGAKPYPIMLCINKEAALVAVASLNYAAEMGLVVKIPA